ncbi:glycosyltransferase family 2 protein [Paraburkholderia sp. 40]|uniref:glycosyltransferase family 2 protein n=1 Tax=unclassified Paraburkholderia TaxID=2615204 RepID=UPI003D1C49A0
MSKVSVLVLTKNEEQDLPGCLETVIGWSDDIHVFDSLSTDGTVAYARSVCANVISRPFDDWSTHQNWGLKNIPFKHEWVLYLDADERVPPLLVPEIETAVSNAGDAVAFQIRRRDFFNDRWLRHVQGSPYFVRLFRPQHIHYERLVNPVTVVDGKTGRLDGYLDHFPFSKGLSHWLSRHNAYSSLEADQFLRNKANGNKFSLSQALFAADFQTRRYHKKRLFYQLPCRPVIKFVLLYFVRRGFLDGHPGLVYATLQSVYEYFIVLKVREKMRAARTQVDRPTLSEELKS